MKKETSIKIFEDKKVRTVWDAENEKWYISIVDVIAVLSESVAPNAYWRKLKQRLKEEGNETVTNCHGLKMLAPDGKIDNITGIIELNANPYQSKILFPAKFRNLDFKTIDKLCKMNKKFEKFIEQTEKLMTASEKYVSGAEKKLDEFCDRYFANDTDLENYCKEKHIPLNEDCRIICSF